MIEDLAAVLERAWSSVSAQSGPEFVAHLMRFMETLKANSLTQGILEDLRGEERDSLARLESASEDARASLRALIGLIESKHGGIRTSEGESDADALYQRLDGRRSTRDPIKQVILGLQAWASDLSERVRERVNTEIEKNNNIEPDSPLKDDIATSRDLTERVNAIDARFAYAVRARALDELAGPGAALVGMQRELDALHPPANRLPRDREHDGSLSHLRNYYFERQPALMNEKGAITQSDPIRRQAALVFEEIRRRLGLERSLRAIFYRYRQRAESYEAARLRHLALENSRTAEARLTSTLAMYLFDHGLNPLTEPMIRGRRPDILGSDARFSFYVEAKQYGGEADKKKKGSRSYLVDGMSQVWDMFDSVRGTPQDVREAFYVVFRRGGPRYQFEVDRLPNGDRLVFPLIIDIAEMTESGTRAPKPIVIEASELMPVRSTSSNASPPPPPERRAERPRARGRRPATRRTRGRRPSRPRACSSGATSWAWATSLASTTSTRAASSGPGR